MKLLYPLILLLFIGCGDKSTEPKSLGIVGVWEGIERRLSETDSYGLINDINSESYRDFAFNKLIFFKNGNYTYEDYYSTSASSHFIEWGRYSVYNNYLTLFSDYVYYYIHPIYEDSIEINNIKEFEFNLTDNEMTWTGILDNDYQSYYSIIFRRIE